MQQTCGCPTHGRILEFDWLSLIFLAYRFLALRLTVKSWQGFKLFFFCYRNTGIRLWKKDSVDCLQQKWNKVSRFPYSRSEIRKKIQDDKCITLKISWYNKLRECWNKGEEDAHS